MQQYNRHKFFIRSLKGLTTAFILISAGLTYTNFGEIHRKKDLIEDIQQIKQMLPKHSMLEASTHFENNFALYGYLYRYAQISLTHTKQSDTCKLVLKDVSELVDTARFKPLLKTPNRMQLYWNKGY